MCLIRTCTKDHTKLGDIVTVYRLGTSTAGTVSRSEVMFSKRRTRRAYRKPGFCGQNSCCCVFRPTNNMPAN